jgi:nucleotide-binding universal stress UspA family protein
MKPRQPIRATIPETILVGFADAERSDHAVRAALDLGDRLKARVDFVHAVRVSPFEWLASDPTRGPTAIARAVENASGTVEEHLSSLSRLRPGAHAAESVRVLPGTPAAVLLDVAREEKAGLIVLGSHKKREPVDFGSTVRAVLARATIPVWIQVVPFRPIAEILVPIDLSEDSLRALSLACVLAQALGAGVRAVHFFDIDRFYALTPDALGFLPSVAVEEIRERAMEDFQKAVSGVDWQGARHSADFVEARPAAGILDASRTADLVVIGTHGRTGLASAVLGGIAHEVLHRSQIPVLAVPHPARKFLM